MTSKLKKFTLITAVILIPGSSVIFGLYLLKKFLEKKRVHKRKHTDF